MKIGIVGQGYVGLPLAIQFAKSGLDVLGLDIDSKKVDAINAGQTYIKHITSEMIADQVKAGLFSASTDFARVRELDAVIICVPTPLNKNREPDISYITDTGRAIAPHLKKGCVVILESTTYPGTTDEDLRKVLEEGSGQKAGTDFHLAFSPEREDPGNPDSKVASIPKVIGGFTPACLEKAMAVYSKAIKTLVPVSSCRAAEATKLVENKIGSNITDTQAAVGQLLAGNYSRVKAYTVHNHLIRAFEGRAEHEKANDDEGDTKDRTGHEASHPRGRSIGPDILF